MSFQPISTGALGYQAILLGAAQSLTTSGTAVQSVPFQNKTSIIRLFATKDMYISIGLNPTATSSDHFMPGGIIEYFTVLNGYTLSALQVSASGILYLSEGY